jgi:hypothetical protein
MDEAPGESTNKPSSRLIAVAGKYLVKYPVSDA